MLLPVFYFVIGAFKERSDIIKFPLLLTKEMFTLENFPYVIKKMDYWAALKNTGDNHGRVPDYRSGERFSGRLRRGANQRKVF